LLVEIWDSKSKEINAENFEEVDVDEVQLRIILHSKNQDTLIEQS